VHLGERGEPILHFGIKTSNYRRCVAVYEIKGSFVGLVLAGNLALARTAAFAHVGGGGHFAGGLPAIASQSLLTTLFHRFDGLVRYPDRVRQKRVVNERSRISIAPFRVLWPSRRIFHDCDLETLLKQFAQGHA
jgi:hypothetical protein